MPCESIGKRILPIFRAYIAKELVEKYGFTQVEAAKRIGTTQAAVSQYLRSKRGVVDLELFKEVLPVIQSAASDVAEKISSGEIMPEEITLKFCELCSSLRKKTLRDMGGK
ncbi:MAG: helix-turn-helix domain-containing protein [Candidatus Bathyarchaeia archaeon]